MKHLTLITLLIATSLSSCTRNNNNNNNKTISNTPDDVIHLNLKEMLAEKVIPAIDSSLITDIRYIPLQTNENSLIGDVDQAFLANNQFFVADFMRTKSLFVFDKDGKFLYKIDKTGKGPGEYVYPSRCDIDSSGNIYIHDNSSQKLIKYSNNGKKFEEFKLNHGFEEFSIIDSDNILVKNTFSRDACLGIINLRNKQLQTLLPFRKPMDDFDVPRFCRSIFFKSGNTIFFSPRFTNKIYKWAGNKMIEVLTFEESLVPPVAFINELKKDAKISYHEDKYVFDIHNTYETPEYIYFSFKNRSTTNIAISKKTKKTILYSSYKGQNMLDHPFIKGFSAGNFISILRTDKYCEPTWKETVSKSTLDNATKSKLSALDAKSNPTIILYRYKDF